MSPRFSSILWLLPALLAGCAHRSAPPPPPPPPPPPFSCYNAPDFHWGAVSRVAILPLNNETSHPQAADDLRQALHASFQQMGVSEVVAVPPPLAARLARQVRETGRFDEAEAIQLARCTGAHVVIAGTLSHFSPYNRPRIGLTLHALSPDLGRVVASVDGLWDATSHPVAQRARLFYAQQRTFVQAVCDRVLGTIDDSFAADLVLDSPHLYGQFVCGEAARLLVADPVFLASLLPAGDTNGAGRQAVPRTAPATGPGCSPAKPRPAP
ncbi:MAG: hypothetical protein K2W96_26930 [Gemmataceae bacterium]|nr:hypothetical protein [Gemmataceae bacterium]